MTTTTRWITIAVVVMVAAGGAAIGFIVRRGNNDSGTCAQLEASQRESSRFSGYVELLRCNGHTVTNASDIDALEVDDRTTVVVRASLIVHHPWMVDEWADEGALVVVVGATDEFGPGDVVSSGGSTSFDRTESNPLVADVDTVISPSGLAYRSAGDATALLADGGGQVLLAAIDTAANSGRIAFLASMDPFVNDAITESDNALLALRLAGAANSTVVLVERSASGAGAENGSGSGSGSGESGTGQSGAGESGGEATPPVDQPPTGLSALPFAWKFALVALGIALVLLAIARGRRNGPPNQPDRALPPRRVGFVDAMAANFAHAHDEANAASTLVDRARAEVIRSAGLGADAPDDEIVAGAETLGLDAAQAQLLRRGSAAHTDVILAARLTTRLNAIRTNEGARR